MIFKDEIVIGKAGDGIGVALDEFLGGDRNVVCLPGNMVCCPTIVRRKKRQRNKQQVNLHLNNLINRRLSGFAIIDKNIET